jgi:hypothetical protein
MQYKVEMQFSYGWDDADWHQPDDSPWRFDTKEEAQKEIDFFCEEMNAKRGSAERRAGEMYDPNDYRVVEA